MSDDPRPVFTGITQIGIVVRDIEATVRRYWDHLGIGPWRFYTIDPANTPGMTLRGRPVEHAFRAALADVGAMEIELIEPLHGDSLYAEHLAAHGEGVHHLGFRVDDFAAAATRLGEHGYDRIQGGQTFGTGEYAYFGTDAALGMIAEIGRGRPAGVPFPPPESTYP